MRENVRNAGGRGPKCTTREADARPKQGLLFKAMAKGNPQKHREKLSHGRQVIHRKGRQYRPVTDKQAEATMPWSGQTRT